MSDAHHDETQILAKGDETQIHANGNDDSNIDVNDEIARLKSINERLLKEQKKYKTRHDEVLSTREELEKLRQEKIEREGNMEEKVNYYKKRYDELADSNAELKMSILNNKLEKAYKRIAPNCQNVDFVVISNNMGYRFELPDYVKTINRENVGFDFGGWSDALLKDDLYKHYDKFIFVNSSVIGPFLKPDFEGKWTDVYVNGLDDDVKLFGSTINTRGRPLIKSHVQSYIFSMDKTTLEYLVACEIFSVTNYAKTFKEAILNKEVLMSRKVIGNKWNIGSLLPCYKGVDFTFRHKKPDEYNIDFLGDLMFPDHKDKHWTVYDLVFIKGNRVEVNVT